ncbi:aminotransferase-like domain-containing protein [Clostridium hydrogenum]|uniref:aminotransferase-like domain-containing protein n=1 Tax=Clostridium hydrogenum TaxID=2855764 RepID=UPI001F27A1BF|nr:PLP-dependent aminotransferase family protein [Clostridium hydrogenum]
MLNIDWKPKKGISEPVYRQIVNYVKSKIASGEWNVGLRLPSQREMAKIFDVNRSTVVEAMEELKADGLIAAKSKGGTVIINNTWSLLASIPPPNWESYIRSGMHEPNIKTIQVINKLEYEDSIVRLGTGELSPELLPKEMIRKVILNVSNKMISLGYERPKGSIELRQAISNYVKKFGIEASPESILIVSGSLQALQLISMSILHKGSSVLIERPSYVKSLHVFESSGIKLKGLAMDNDGVRPSEILKNTKEASLLYTIPTFHNPTGKVMSQKRREEILKLCTKERLPIIEDDAYRELYLEGNPPQSLKSMDKNGIVLYMGTISKVLAAGMRIGWLIGPEAVIERLADVKMQTDYGASSLSQYFATEWISSGLHEKYLQQLREKLKIKRDFTISILNMYFKDIAEWNVPSGGFYIWLNLKYKIDIEKLFYDACKIGILINPGYMYDFNKNYNIRISYSYASVKEIEEGLKKLSWLIKKRKYR